MKRNKQLQEACQQAKLEYMTKKLHESVEVKYVIYVMREDEDSWRPWGGRTECPSKEDFESLKDWLLSSGYKDVTIVPNGSQPVSMQEDIEKLEVEEAPIVTSIDEAVPAATMLNNLIQDEWQAVQGYNDAIATLTSMNFGEDIIKVLTDIVEEENVHIGQLQKALELVSPSAESIKVGEEEGAEQLANKE